MMITRRLVLALVAVAVTPPMLAWSFRSEPKLPRPQPTLSDRLNEVDGDFPAAKKEDRLPEVRAVRTIPITQPPAAAIGAEASERLRNVVLTPPPEAEDDPPRTKKSPSRIVRRTREARGDVCSRHHMRKVMVGKYRWRCRR